MIETIIDIPTALTELVSKLNSNDITQDIFANICKTGNKYGGLIPQLIEQQLLKILSNKYPQLDLIHPADDCHLGDFYSDVINEGIELKVCQGRGKMDQTVWENSTTQEHSKNFLFVRISYKDNKLILNYAYYGYMSYSNWRIRSDNGMCVGLRTVRKCCKKIM